VFGIDSGVCLAFLDHSSYIELICPLVRKAPMETGTSRQELLALTAEIVASFVGNNAVATGDLPALIQSVFGTLRSTGEPEPPKAPEAPVPAVPIKKSIGTDYIVCLEDGKKLKMLKRYLATRYDMTPEDYRRRWGLPADYPMVAPAYAERRSALAKSLGLGRKPAPAPAEPPAAAAKAPPRARAVRVGGRRKAS
jgi:predicted transcriptional regulator